MLLLDSNVITPILLSDSKRLYLEKHILPGMDQRIKLVYNVPYLLNSAVKIHEAQPRQYFTLYMYMSGWAHTT